MLHEAEHWRLPVDDDDKKTLADSFRPLFEQIQKLVDEAVAPISAKLDVTIAELRSLHPKTFEEDDREEDDQRASHTEGWMLYRDEDGRWGARCLEGGSRIYEAAWPPRGDLMFTGGSCSNAQISAPVSVILELVTLNHQLDGHRIPSVAVCHNCGYAYAPYPYGSIYPDENGICGSCGKRADLRPLQQVGMETISYLESLLAEPSNDISDPAIMRALIKRLKETV